MNHRVTIDTDHIEINLTESQLSAFAAIAEEAARRMRMPGAHTCEGFALTADDKSAGIWSAEAVKCDVLGWVLRAAAEKLDDHTERRMRCLDASICIGQRVLRLTGRSMIEMNDADGCEAAATALDQAAASYSSELERRQYLKRYR